MMKHITYRVLGLAIGLIMTPHAFAASAPAVITNNVTAMAQTSATMWGVVDANGPATSFWFEYGTSYNLSNRSNVQPLFNAGRANVSFDATGLQPGTTYFYRVVAQNGFGVATGDVQQFNTAPGNSSSQTTVKTTNTTTATTNGGTKTTTVAQKPAVVKPVVAVKPVQATTTVASGNTNTTVTPTSTTATSTDKGSFLANAWSTITNIPGYIWFFLFLLIAILFVTYSFFRVLRGQASGEDDGHDAHH